MSPIGRTVDAFRVVGGHVGFRHTALEAARQPTNRAAFSTAAHQDTDRELEDALDELLGDAVKEAENPLLEGRLAKGHVEGSREFPKELLDVVSLQIYSRVIPFD